MSYEGIGSISEKIFVVIDIGSAYTKFGFAGEFSPRCIIPSEIKMPSTGIVRKIADYQDKDDLFDILVEFVFMLYTKYALINAKGRAVIIVESLLCPTIFRDTLAKVLFCHFEVGSIIWLPSHLVCLSTLNVETAIVLDVGYKEAVLFPIYQGVPLLNAWQALPLGSLAVHSQIKAILKGENYDYDIAEKYIEDIKVRTCFVTNLERSKQYALNKSPTPCPGLDYPIMGHQSVKVSGKLRETAFEVLFELDNDYQSVTTMILDAILQCPKDMRKELAENILLIGGTVMTTGFKARLREELLQQLESDRYKDKLFLKTFKFHSAPAKENYTAWLGGAIYGCTDIVSMRCLTKEAYLKDRRVPDWSNLQDNKLQNVL
ncbi:actin-related protein 10 [Chrysoperla carnea]|uniref:actin-related protein 10 n=1 Tax=Chrysoperla carnea TaxID=189513 RepID=UPI001D089759|nr:actin-related protein 10 [Chrysoperla carnea]